jgi:uncharacterized protein
MEYSSQYEYRHVTSELMGIDGNTVEGYAIVYNSPSVELNFPKTGAFREIILPGAATESLTADIPALYAHDRKEILGRTSSGTLQLREDSNGVYASLKLGNSSRANDIRDMVKRKDLTGWSFYIAVEKDSWARDAAGAKVRSVHKLAAIPEITLTPFPAYQSTTIALRSYEEWEKSNLVVPLSVRMRQLLIAKL